MSKLWPKYEHWSKYKNRALPVSSDLYRYKFGSGGYTAPVPHLYLYRFGSGGLYRNCSAPVPVQVAEITHKWGNSPFFMHFSPIILFYYIVHHKLTWNSSKKTPPTPLISQRIQGFIPKFIKLYKTLEL